MNTRTRTIDKHKIYIFDHDKSAYIHDRCKSASKKITTKN